MKINKLLKDIDWLIKWITGERDAKSSIEQLEIYPQKTVKKTIKKPARKKTTKKRIK